ncbi:MAG: hypothetical protein IJS28_11725 [Synergistaceae bacterium]|nr:hypothetical protein [Synergistaceae bacterium]
MTLKEEACEIINKLPDRVMGDILQMLRVTANSPSTWERPELARMRKKEALRDLQFLREDARRLGSMEFAAAREEAMFEKYGV